ncbi:TPA: hypothetical protein ACH3X2_003973 [Trebouxia sp. C0005]
MTGYLPVVSAASLLAADTPSEQLPSNELLQTWHRLRLAVLHSIWAASQIAQASRPTQAPDASEPVATLVSSPSSQQASFTSHHGHLARQLALKTIRAMIRNDWTTSNDDIRQISGVCSSWLRGKDPNMTLAAFQSLCFKRPSEHLLKQLSQQLRKFVASAQQPNHSDDAVALAQGHSQGSAQLPCAAPGAALFPGELASSLPLSKGGVGLVHVPTQVQALQAKVISRLLEPERLAWKVFQLHHLSQASQVQPLGYGASILFRTLHTDQLQLPARLSAYVAAFRALHPHRLQSVSAMLPSDVLNEPLFFNKQISRPATSPAAINTACPAAAASFLTPQQKPLMLSAGITKVAHLRLSLQLQQPSCWHSS